MSLGERARLAAKAAIGAMQPFAVGPAIDPVGSICPLTHGHLNGWNRRDLTHSRCHWVSATDSATTARCISQSG